MDGAGKLGANDVDCSWEMKSGRSGRQDSYETKKRSDHPLILGATGTSPAMTDGPGGEYETNSGRVAGQVSYETKKLAEPSAKDWRLGVASGCPSWQGSIFCLIYV